MSEEDTSTCTPDTGWEMSRPCGVDYQENPGVGNNQGVVICLDMDLDDLATCDSEWNAVLCPVPRRRERRIDEKMASRRKHAYRRRHAPTVSSWRDRNPLARTFRVGKYPPGGTTGEPLRQERA